MMKYTVLLTSFAVALSLAIPGKPVVPVGAWQVDARHSDAQLVTDATTNYGKTKINFTLGNARVAGRVKLDNNDPAKSSFDFTMYPANSAAPAIGEDGKVRLCPHRRRPPAHHRRLGPNPR
jgi:polyisoprenoid-binding protein YceI